MDENGQARYLRRSEWHLVFDDPADEYRDFPSSVLPADHANCGVDSQEVTSFQELYSLVQVLGQLVVRMLGGEKCTDGGDMVRIIQRPLSPTTS